MKGLGLDTGRAPSFIAAAIVSGAAGILFDGWRRRTAVRHPKGDSAGRVENRRITKKWNRGGSISLVALQ